MRKYLIHLLMSRTNGGYNTRLLLYFLVLLQSPICIGQVSFEWKCDSNKILIGDRLRAILIISADPEANLEKIDTAAILQKSQLELLGTQNGDSFKTNFSTITKKSFFFTAFSPGVYYLPSHDFNYQYNGKTLTAKLDSFAVEVYEPSINDTTRLSPIKPIWKEEKNYVDYLPLFILILFIIGILYIFKKTWDKRHQIKQDQIAFNEDPYEWMLGRLRLAIQLSQKDQETWLKEYSKLGSDFKKMLDKTICKGATEMTSIETAQKLKEKDRMRREDITQLKKFFENTDLIKFAKGMPEASDFNVDTLWLEQWLVSRIVKNQPHETK